MNKGHDGRLCSLGLLRAPVKLQHKSCVQRTGSRARSVTSAVWYSGQPATVTKAVSWRAVGVDKAEG